MLIAETNDLVSSAAPSGRNKLSRESVGGRLEAGGDKVTIVEVQGFEERHFGDEKGVNTFPVVGTADTDSGEFVVNGADNASGYATVVHLPKEVVARLLPKEGLIGKKGLVNLVAAEVIAVVDLEKNEGFLVVDIKFQLDRLDFHAGQHPLAVDALATAVEFEPIPKVGYQGFRFFFRVHDFTVFPLLTNIRTNIRTNSRFFPRQTRIFVLINQRTEEDYRLCS